MMRRIIWGLFFLLAFSPVSAQDGVILPSVITPENVAHIAPLTFIGGDLPGQLAWSPDGATLAVGTTSGVWLYTAAAWDAEPRFIPGGLDVLFNGSGDVLVSGGRLWDVATGDSLLDITGQLASQDPISPGGDVLVTSGEESGAIVLWLWDISSSASVQLLAMLPTGLHGRFAGVVFNPDESVIAVKLFKAQPEATLPAVVQLWNIADGSFIAWFGHRFDTLDPVAFSDDGSLLVVASESTAPYGDPIGEVRLWDVRSGEAVRLWDYAFQPVQFIPGTHAVTFRDFQGVIHLWDGTDHTLAATERLIDYLSNLSPSGHWFAGYKASSDTVALWKVNPATLVLEESSIQLQANRKDDWQYIERLTFSPAETLLLTYHNNFGNPQNNVPGGVRFWDISTNALASTIPDLSVSDFGPDEHLVLTRSGPDFHLWDVLTGEQRLTLPLQSRLNPAWTQVAYWDGGAVRVVDVADKAEQILTVIAPYRGAIMAFNPGTEQVVFAGTSLTGYDLQTGEPIFDFPAAEGAVLEAALSANGEHLTAMIAPDKTRNTAGVSVWNLLTPDALPYQLESNYRGIGDLQLSPDGRLLAVRALGAIGGGMEPELFWEISHQALTIWWIESAGMSAHVFSPDGSLLATGGRDSFVSLWDVAEVSALGNQAGHLPEAKANLWFGSQSDTEGLAFSPDGRLLAITELVGEEPESPRHQINLLQVADMLRLDAPMDVQQAGDDIVTILNADRVIAFTPDSLLLLTYTTETDIFQLWDTETGVEVAALTGGALGTFSPDGTLLATYDVGGLSFWPVESLINGDLTPLATVDTAARDIQEIAFSGDGTRLFAQMPNGVLVWGVLTP